MTAFEELAIVVLLLREENRKPMSVNANGFMELEKTEDEGEQAAVHRELAVYDKDGVGTAHEYLGMPWHIM